MERKVTLIYATSTGNSEVVADVIIRGLEAELPTTRITKKRAEITSSDDMTDAEILIFVCGSWNTGNVEGQLNPYMFELLNGRAKEVILKRTPTACVGLGDDRYYFKAQAAEKLAEWCANHGGTSLIPVLKVVNDPYGQEEKIEIWTHELAKHIRSLPLSLAA